MDTYDLKRLRFKPLLITILAAVAVMSGLFAHAQPAYAQDPSNGETDIAVNGCMQDVAGFGLNCTANDIQIAGVTSLTILDDGCAFPGDTVTFSADFEVLLTAQARHDIGLWFDTAGDPEGDGAITGTCTVGTPAYAPDPPWLDLDGTGDTFLDTNVVSNIQDTCGDIDDMHNPLFPSMTITAQCVAGPDGNLSLPNCTSWKQPGDNDLCTGPLPEADIGGPGLDSSGVPPGAPSKCRCDEAFTVPIRVPGFITVDKVTVDSDGNPLPGDPTLFDFSITGPDSDLPDDFSLADADPIHTSPPIETTDEDGNVVGPYQVTETTPTPTGWDLDSASCTRDNATPDDLSDDTTFDYTNGGDIQPLPGEVVACTFTNKQQPGTLTLVKTVINDNGGTLDVADFPLFMNGNLVTSGQTVTFNAGTDVTASETQQPGYTASAWGGDCAADGSVTIEAGVDKTCTITNDDDAPSLLLQKLVVNDNGGTAVASDWTLSAGANNVTGSETPTEATDQAGTYDLSETSVTGYTNTSVTCDNGNGPDSVSIGLGETVTCTFVNDDDAPSLLLQKLVVNDNGGTAVASDWTLSAGANNVTGSETPTEATDQAGTYDLSETSVTGYTNTSVTCDNGNGPDSVSIGLGETVTCTFVNDDDAPSLLLQKLVVNDNGGTAVASDWTLSAGANNVTGSETPTEATDQAGTYDLSETSVTGYTNTSVTCDNGNGPDSVSIGLGETVTCTFVNDDDAPSLLLQKLVVNDNGGTAVASDWTLSAGANNVTGSETPTEATDQAGTYDLSETSVTGYTNTSVTCDNGNGPDSVSIGLGETVTCTFVNDDDAPSLLLQKLVVNDNGGTAVASDWTLSAGANNVTGSETPTEATDQAGTYDLSETSVTGYTNTSVTCDNGNGPDSVSIGLGETVTCTFVNDDDAPSLLLQKLVVNDNGGTAVASDWTLSAGANNVTGSETPTEATDQAGTYDLSETSVTGYTNTSVTCDNGNGPDSVSIGLGETVTCTFVNDDDAPSLLLQKLVVNDNGGTAVASDWTLSAGANNVTGSETPTEATDQAGTYDLSETSVTGYTNTSVTCDNGNGPDSVSIGLGETVTCTFVNDDDAPSLLLQKLVVNDNGGTAVASDWTLSAGANNVTGSETPTEATDQAGTYDLSETSVTGYTNTSVTCDNGNGPDSVSIGLGETVTCTFVNDDDAPSLLLQKLVVNDNGGTAVASDWTLSAGANNVTGSETPTEATDQAGTYDLSETSVTGYTNTSVTCDNGNGPDSVSIGLGETVTCTFVNDDIPPKLTLIKVVENGSNPGGTAVATDWTLIASGPTGFSGVTGVTSDANFDQGTYDLSETGPGGYIASDWVCTGGTQNDGDTITVGLGEDATCTVTNTAMGMVELLKLTNGAENQTMVWNFTLTGPGVNETDSSPPTTVDFGGAKLIPGEEYTLCETGIPAGWTLEWQVDTDGDGIPDIIIPVVTGVNNDPVDPATGYSRVYDPNYVPPPGQFTNDTRCVNFVVDVGETLAFQIDNQFPGGEPRTIGYWKNWNTCTGGNQPQTAANNGGPAGGWYILDDLLNDPGYTIGILQLDGSDCEDAVNLLDKREITGNNKKKANDAAYNLASQLLAAQLNLSAGAETCQAVVDAVNAGQTLLASINFDGSGNYLRPKDGQLYTDANNLATTLDEYNNGLLCSP